jgi:hypothetical protein
MVDDNRHSAARREVIIGMTGICRTFCLYSSSGLFMILCQIRAKRGIHASHVAIFRGWVSPIIICFGLTDDHGVVVSPKAKGLAG